MLIISGISLPQKKKLSYSLPLLYGIGLSQAKRLCRKLALSPNSLVEDLDSEKEILLMKKLKENFYLEGGLKEKIRLNIEKLILNKSRKGFRHKSGLPVRGQRTCSNAKTSRRLFKKKF
jgi:small subunit ribosomal protein S13